MFTAAMLARIGLTVAINGNHWQSLAIGGGDRQKGEIIAAAGGEATAGGRLRVGMGQGQSCGGAGKGRQ